jgi:hypothetical protein
MITTQIADTPEKIAFDLPKAVGVVRYDLSESNADRHTVAIRRHAETLGYDYLYTVHPPADAVDPVAYALVLAATLGADAIVVYDLGHVNNQPALVCDEGFDLETVCPQWTWLRCGSANVGRWRGAA